MLKQPMIEKLAAMRLLEMAEALRVQEQDPSARELSFLERFGLLVDQQWNWRENQALSRRLKNAKLRTPNACAEEIDHRTTHGLRQERDPFPDAAVLWGRDAREHLRAWTNGSGQELCRLRSHRRHAAMVIRRFTRAPNRCFATWRWRVLMAASAVYCRGLAASMSL
jgi:IstB-like ATP binding protein